MSRWLAILAAGVFFIRSSALSTARDAKLPGNWSRLVVSARSSRQYFASPDGKPENAGTKDLPFDLKSALAGQRGIAAGDILWVRGGEYRGNFEIRLTGRDDAPIHVRTYPGERATLVDSPLSVMEPSAYVWLWDLELAGSVPTGKRETKQTGSAPSDLPPTGGLNVHYGKACKYIDLVIHDNIGNGVGWWVGSTDSEIHGCIIYNNGWRAPDRGHGHCIYTQNQNGVKTISNCILRTMYDGSYTVHAYGSKRSFVDNYILEDNIVFERGPFLVGGGSPSHNIKVAHNYLYGVSMRIGYGAENEDCEVRNNIIAGGTLTIEKYRKSVNEGNSTDVPEYRTVLIPNKYDLSRAHLAVYNGKKARQVRVPVAPFLRSGDRYRVQSATNLFGKPAAEGFCKDGSILVPMSGEFEPFVLFKEPAAGK